MLVLATPDGRVAPALRERKGVQQFLASRYVLPLSIIRINQALLGLTPTQHCVPKKSRFSLSRTLPSGDK